MYVWFTLIHLYCFRYIQIVEKYYISLQSFFYSPMGNNTMYKKKKKKNGGKKTVGWVLVRLHGTWGDSLRGWVLVVNVLVF